MKKLRAKDFLPAKDHIKLTPGQMLTTLRKLQNLSQNQLSQITGISQSNISNMESGRHQIGRERAIILGKALKVHPAIIIFPNYRIEDFVA